LNLFSRCTVQVAAVITFLTLLSSPSVVYGNDLCVQLKWYHQSQFAGFYVAKEAGLYKSEGLNISFKEGGPHIDWQKQMSNADCPIGITNAYEIVKAKANSIRVKAIATVAQVSPVVWFSLKESGIRDPRQFKGKSIALVPTGKIHLRGMLKKVGVSLDDIQLKPFSLDLTPLYAKEVDVWSGYVTNLVTKAQQDGYEVNVIHPINYGVQIYDDVIYAREEFIDKSPDVLEKFLRASLNGWAEAIKDTETAVLHTLKYSRSKDRMHEQRLLERSIPYIHTGEVPIGWMEEEIWHEICQLTWDVGLTKQCVLSENMFTDVFLRIIYGDQ